MKARFGWAAWKALRRDAARYRWIRYNGGCPLSGWDIADTDAERDAAVDADMQPRYELTEAGRALLDGAK